MRLRDSVAFALTIWPYHIRLHRCHTGGINACLHDIITLKNAARDVTQAASLTAVINSSLIGVQKRIYAANV